MSKDITTSLPSSPQKKNRGWLYVFGIGLALFVVATILLFLTGASNLYPTVILLGNFLVPATFVTFLYDHQHRSHLTPQTIMQSFGLGGVLGILGAVALESTLLPFVSSGHGLTLPGALFVGLIEEGCKITTVMILARRKQHTEEIDGILLGAAVGMGFAALESTGYAFSFFIASGNQINALLFETVLRGLLAPFGHGVWTAIISAVLFRESTKTRFRFTSWVILTYLFVALLLHGMWDGVPLLGLPPLYVLGAFPLIGIIGTLLLWILYRQALHRQAQQALAAIQEKTILS
jgi:RsiW-degrading membrane proteinase PrsW (M82 family)